MQCIGILSFPLQFDIETVVDCAIGLNVDSDADLSGKDFSLT